MRAPRNSTLREQMTTYFSAEAEKMQHNLVVYCQQCGAPRARQSALETFNGRDWARFRCEACDHTFSITVPKGGTR